MASTCQEWSVNQSEPALVPPDVGACRRRPSCQLSDQKFFLYFVDLRPSLNNPSTRLSTTFLQTQNMAAAISAEPILGEVSPGVRRIQAEASTIRSWHRWVFFFAIFLCAYSYGLDGQVRYTFQVSRSL